MVNLTPEVGLYVKKTRKSNGEYIIGKIIPPSLDWDDTNKWVRIQIIEDGGYEGIRNGDNTVDLTVDKSIGEYNCMVKIMNEDMLMAEMI